MILTIFTTLIAILFSLFSTAIISYIAMATPIGPWMEMTLVLLGTIIFKTFAQHISVKTQMRSLAFTTAAGGIGGAIAMACAFSFPTLFFLDPLQFNSLMEAPFYFCSILALLVIVAGSFGFLIAHYFEDRLLRDSSIVFPIGQMVYNMIAIQNQAKKALQLTAGALSALVYGIVQHFVFLLPTHITLLPPLQMGIFNIPSVFTRTDMIPMFWAIGFITGHVIALPLLVAVIARLFLIEPFHILFFNFLSRNDFILAFGAGMAIQGAFLGIIEMPKILQKSVKNICNNFCIKLIWFDRLTTNGKKRTTTARPELVEGFERSNGSTNLTGVEKRKFFLHIIALIIFSILFLTYFSFSFPAQLYLLLFTLLCTYQLIIIAGKFGIAPLGRFATFVMIPGLLIFEFNAIQATLLVTFIEVSGIAAVDMMFGKKVAQLASIERAHMMFYQWLGLLVSAISIGVIFWVLISHFGLGCPELIASRAQSRALLVHVFHFDYCVLLLGFLFSYTLKYIKINPTLVFGGLLMELDTSLLLIAGGLSTYVVKDKEEHYPFWSGIYATNSLWIFIKMLL